MCKIEDTVWVLDGDYRGTFGKVKAICGAEVELTTNRYGNIFVPAVSLEAVSEADSVMVFRELEEDYV